MDNIFDDAVFRAFLIIIWLVCAVGIVCIIIEMCEMRKKAREEEVANALYTHTVTYYLNADGDITEGDNTSYPISNLRTNATGTRYRWIERKQDGSLVTQTARIRNKPEYEVTLKDDLPATGKEARVERIVEYRVKGADLEAGKDLCVLDSYYDPFNLFPVRGNMEESNTRFLKSRIIIHIPAGSAETMLPIVNE
jgi:hypothetical protein